MRTQLCWRSKSAEGRGRRLLLVSETQTDMMWLRQQGVALPVRLIPVKIRDHRCTVDDFVLRLQARLGELNGMPGMRDDFRHEMRRFLPADIVRETVENPSFWSFLVAETTSLAQGVVASLRSEGPDAGFRMA